MVVKRTAAASYTCVPVHVDAANFPILGSPVESLIGGAESRAAARQQAARCHISRARERPPSGEYYVVRALWIATATPKHRVKAKWKVAGVMMNRATSMTIAVTTNEADRGRGADPGLLGIRKGRETAGVLEVGRQVLAHPRRRPIHLVYLPLRAEAEVEISTGRRRRRRSVTGARVASGRGNGTEVITTSGERSQETKVTGVIRITGRVRSEASKTTNTGGRINPSEQMMIIPRFLEMMTRTRDGRRYQGKRSRCILTRMMMIWSEKRPGRSCYVL